MRTEFYDRQRATTEQSYADDDPYHSLKRNYHAITGSLSDKPFVTVDADTVARAVLRGIRAKNPKSRYIAGLSGKASVLARLLLTDRMWDGVMLRSLSD